MGSYKLRGLISIVVCVIRRIANANGGGGKALPATCLTGLRKCASQEAKMVRAFEEGWEGDNSLD